MSKGIKNIKLNVFSVQIIYMCAIILISSVIACINRITFFVGISIVFVTTIVCIYMCIKEFKERKNRINELSESINLGLKTSLDLVNLPMAIVALPTDVVWQNNMASHLIPKEIIIDTALAIEKQKDSKDITVDIGNGDKYLAIGNKVKFLAQDTMLITYIDKTEEDKLKKILEDTKIAVGIISLDNYDETMQGLDEVKKAEIASKITKVLADFISENKGIITKIDKDKYVIFVERQYVKKMEGDSFLILEEVKKVTQESKLVVTISIGMSYIESTLDERYKSASSALDIALGRGGDQTVIKRDKKFDFYGGTNIGIEKTSKVRARTISQAVKETIEKCDSVYIVGHKNTDIDCIGAAVGIAKIAKHFNKSVYIVVDTKCNSSTKTVIQKVKETGNYDDVFVTKEDIKKINSQNSVLFVVDTHKKSYLSYSDILDEFEKVIIIDHHRRGTEFIENAFLTYHEIYASSTSELVTEILMYLNDIKLLPEEAEVIYAGIVVDTKNFMFKTGVRTFEVAAYLKKFGIDLTDVKQIFQSDFETYIAKVDIVKNAEIIKGKIAVSTTEEEYKEMPIIAAQAADELLSISGIIASFVLCRVENIIMISGRSMGDINVQSILEKIGGGGHLTFAGAQIAGVSIEEAKEKLLDSINEYFGE